MTGDAAAGAVLGLGEADCRRPQRADARKNRARLLEAAEEVFAEKGVAVPVDEVACRAGVGVGTLYRHFPTKEALFAAVVATRLEQLRDESACLLSAPDAGGAFFGFAERMGDQVATKHDLADALAAAGIDIKAEMAEVMEQLRLNLRGLISRAQAAGALRCDITEDELFGLVSASCIAAQQVGLGEDGRKRCLAVIFDGLRPGAAAPTSPG